MPLIPHSGLSSSLGKLQGAAPAAGFCANEKPKGRKRTPEIRALYMPRADFQSALAAVNQHRRSNCAGEVCCCWCMNVFCVVGERERRSFSSTPERKEYKRSSHSTLY